MVAGWPSRRAGDRDCTVTSKPLEWESSRPQSPRHFGESAPDHTLGRTHGLVVVPVQRVPPGRTVGSEPPQNGVAAHGVSEATIGHGDTNTERQFSRFLRGAKFRLLLPRGVPHDRRGSAGEGACRVEDGSRVARSAVERPGPGR